MVVLKGTRRLANQILNIGAKNDTCQCTHFLYDQFKESGLLIVGSTSVIVFCGYSQLNLLYFIIQTIHVCFENCN